MLVINANRWALDFISSKPFAMPYIRSDYHRYKALQGVYAFIDKPSRMLKIGASIDIRQRLSQHGVKYEDKVIIASALDVKAFNLESLIHGFLRRYRPTREELFYLSMAEFLSHLLMFHFSRQPREPLTYKGLNK